MTRKLYPTVETAEGEIPKVQKFTDDLIASLPQPLPGKDYYLVDETVLNTHPNKPYFQLRVTQKKKKFKVVFQTYSKTTGLKQTDKKDFPNCSSAHPDISVANARRLVKVLYKQIMNPNDPDPFAAKAELKMKRGEPTLETLLEEYLVHGRRNRTIAANSEVTIRSRIKAHCKDYLSKPFSDINNRKVLTAMADTGASVMDGVLRTLGAIVRFTETRYLDDNEKPMYPINYPSTIRREYKLDYSADKDCLRNKDDFRKFSKLLNSTELKHFEQHFLLFVLLTGYRPGILMKQLSWKQLDFQKGTYKLIPKSRPNAEEGTAMPLPKLVIQQMQHLDKTQAPFQRVFPVNLARVNKLLTNAMDRKFTLKHLRKTFVTIAEAIQIDPPVIAALVNHKWGEANVTDTNYKNWEAVKELRADLGIEDNLLSTSLDRINDAILKMMPDYHPEGGTKVVHIKSASK